VRPSQGEDDALVNGAAFQPAVGLGCLVVTANGNFSVVVMRCFLLRRPRLAAVPALPGPARGPDLQSLPAES
jgi:hypothetical protein